jgi:GH24 family phage-related lysozyme (muramidase)
MNVSNKVFTQLKSNGFRPRSYKDSLGNTAIGYGHVLKPGDGVVPTEIINNFKASLLLLNDVQEVVDKLLPNVPKNITQEEFDSLVISQCV